MERNAKLVKVKVGTEDTNEMEDKIRFDDYIRRKKRLNY